MPVPTTSLDRRLVRKTGNFDSHPELVEFTLNSKEEGLSTAEIAEEAGVSKATIQRLINDSRPVEEQATILEATGIDSQRLNSLWRIPTYRPETTYAT